jgi:hypothetical protein
MSVSKQLEKKPSSTHVGQVHLVVNVNLLGQLVNPVGDLLRCRSTVITVELDPDIVVRPTGVVGGGEEDPTVGLSRPDQGGDGWGGEDGVLADDQRGDAVTGSETDDLLDGLGGLSKSSKSGDRSGVEIPVKLVKGPSRKNSQSTFRHLRRRGSSPWDHQAWQSRWTG